MHVINRWPIRCIGVPYAYRAGRYAYGKPIRVYSYGPSHMRTGNIRIWVRTLIYFEVLLIPRKDRMAVLCVAGNRGNPTITVWSTILLPRAITAQWKVLECWNLVIACLSWPVSISMVHWNSQTLSDKWELTLHGDLTTGCSPMDGEFDCSLGFFERSNSHQFPLMYSPGGGSGA